MNEELTDTVEDYLRVIYDLSCEQGRAATSQIAARMSVKPASVTGMVKRLATSDPPLVEYHKNRGVTLTRAGQGAALEIIRHHRLLELFLHQRLGYTRDEVHAEADLLEHVISERLEERIAQALGDPSRDPHGHPIPTRDLRMPPQSTTRLGDLQVGQQASIEQLPDGDSDLLRYLDQVGLVPEARLAVLERLPFDENLRLQVEGQPDTIVLGPRVLNQILVKIL